MNKCLSYNGGSGLPVTTNKQSPRPIDVYASTKINSMESHPARFTIVEHLELSRFPYRRFAFPLNNSKNMVYSANTEITDAKIRKIFVIQKLFCIFYKAEM